MSKLSNQVATKFLAKTAGNQDLADAVDSLDQALTNIQDAVDILFAGGGEESPENMSGQVYRTSKDLKVLMVQLHKYKSILDRSQSKFAAGGARLDASLRKRINAEISRFISNKYFDKAQQGLSGILEILSNNGIELNDIVNSYMFASSDANMKQDLAFSNPEQPMAPEPIRNSMLIFSFHEMQSGRFEITAYVS